MSVRRRQVAVVQKVIPPYRADFFERLRVELDSRSIDLELICGDGKRRDGGENVPPPWATVARLREVNVRGHRVQYHHVVRRTRHADLIVTEQASKALHTLMQIVLQRFGGVRVALWGHGVNMQPSRRSDVAERLKRFSTARAHWFFAYTPGTGELVKNMGFEPDRIQVLHNSTDTVPLRNEVLRLRSQMTATQATADCQHGIFVGRLYDLKRPDFLLDAVICIQEALPDFQLTIIGSGPLADSVSERARTMTGVHVVGEKMGNELALLMAKASVMMLPGMVGLAAVDAIATELPSIVIDDQEHSPEFEYFADGKTAIVLPRSTSPQQYADVVRSLLQSPETLQQMRTACHEMAPFLTMDQMVDEFANGVESALQAPRRNAPADLRPDSFGL